MERDEIDREIEIIKSTYKDLEKKINPTDLQNKINSIEPITRQPNFWDNPQHAKKVMKELQTLKDKLENLKNISSSIEDIEAMIELKDEAEYDLDTEQQAQKDIEKMTIKTKKVINKLEITTYLGDKYDSYDAILSIHAGQGGTEACDWTQMLLRMYMKYFDKQEWKYEITDEIKGNEAGINTVSLEISGTYVYGYLKHEHGTHRLVRISPFNAQGLRQTSFAGVEVLPIFEDDIEIKLNPDDIEFHAVRSSGPGGQHVNKSATSVRLIHKPSGIVVTNSSGRSQHQNKEAAMKMLRAKLFQKAQEERNKEREEASGDYKIPGWGNQIRNYVLHPYKLVKDLRTKVETDQVESVLDGELDEFIEAEIKL
ncbi:peptide chain release factor 2 [Candidatus Dojkabacteria bacterium]|nr:peptide chain release factor 2 [Candidatus Dojkabacteria bacterium]